MTEIARLLTVSQKAHQDARRARHDQKPSRAREYWQVALDARTDAHTQDPEHLDPAWAEEQALTPGRYDTHSELMQFYAERGVVYQGAPKAEIQPVSRVRPEVKALIASDMSDADKMAAYLALNAKEEAERRVAHARTVIMCACDDYMACGHLYPQMLLTLEDRISTNRPKNAICHAVDTSVSLKDG